MTKQQYRDAIIRAIFNTLKTATFPQMPGATPEFLEFSAKALELGELAMLTGSAGLAVLEDAHVKGLDGDAA